jgi:hypothetical protein
LSKNNAFLELTGTEFLTKVDTESKLCVYHPINILLPTRSEGYWVVHDELESLQKQAIIDLGKFVIDGVGAVVVKATEGVAAISLYLVIGSIIDAIQDGGDPPDPIDVTGINTNINSLNNTTNSILGYINNYTRYSI